MSIPTRPRDPHESFEDWATRIETDVIDAFQEDRFATFALLTGPDGVADLTPETGENDEYFFRRVQARAREEQADRFVGATIGRFNAGPLGAVSCLLWFVADAVDGRAAHGLGQVFGDKVYSRQQVAPGNAPRAMRDVIRIPSS